MFAQMQEQIAARNLAIEWSTRIEAVVAIDREAEKSLIEFVRLGDVEDAQNGYDPIEADLQQLPPVINFIFVHDRRCRFLQ
jgi:hypothetical protein